MIRDDIFDYIVNKGVKVKSDYNNFNYDKNPVLVNRNVDPNHSNKADVPTLHDLMLIADILTGLSLGPKEVSKRLNGSTYVVGSIFSTVVDLSSFNRESHSAGALNLLKTLKGLPLGLLQISPIPTNNIPKCVLDYLESIE